MSSISGVGANTTDLYTLLQTINSQDASQSTTTPTAASVAATDDTTTDATTSTHKHHHHKGGGSSAIESAVTDALDSAEPGTDPNTTVKNAIASILNPTGTQSASTDGTTGAASTTSFSQLLQSNGINPQQFQQDLADALQGSSQNANGTASSNTTASGSVDFATLFRNFPPGSTVDTVG